VFSITGSLNLGEYRLGSNIFGVNLLEVRAVLDNYPFKLGPLTNSEVGANGIH